MLSVKCISDNTNYITHSQVHVVIMPTNPCSEVIGNEQLIVSSSGICSDKEQLIPYTVYNAFLAILCLHSIILAFCLLTMHDIVQASCLN